VGWLFGPILALYGVVYACHAQAWRLCMPRGQGRPSFGATYAITVSGFSLNFVTPLVNAGGEPFRAAAVAPWLGRRAAASSVVVHRMLNTLGLLLTWLTALLLTLLLVPCPLWLTVVLSVAAAAVTALALLLLRSHRRGGLVTGLDLLLRLPLPARIASSLGARRETLARMDHDIAAAYHDAPSRFSGALALEYGARCVYMLEYWLICLGAGVPASLLQAYLIGGLSSLALNALFFVPFELGSKEAVLYLLFGVVGLDPRAGVITALVSRARDLAWIGAGLLLLAALLRRRSASATIHAVETAAS
jgi:Lysylphosphatidylglycerol synthase TM region